MALLIFFATSGIGCASSGSTLAAKPSVVKQFETWPYRDKLALTVRSAHYSIHTTIDDRHFLTDLATLMESALSRYEQFTPAVIASADPMDCYMFARRPEWADFTAAKTGTDAALYLQINRGGYTVRDWYVAYYIGELGTYAVAAHEGWHQYVARNFKSRLPPFLEEGIATMFENVRYNAPNPPEWDLSPRSPRALKLQAAIASDNLFPLSKLITMHAGEVVGMSGGKIEAFYAQSWAFAEFLWNAESGKYRPAFQRLLSDCANGIARPQAVARRSIFDTWNPQSVQPMLENYLCLSMPDLDRAYQAYIREIAFKATAAGE